MHHLVSFVPSFPGQISCVPFAVSNLWPAQQVWPSQSVLDNKYLLKIIDPTFEQLEAFVGEQDVLLSLTSLEERQLDAIKDLAELFLIPHRPECSSQKEGQWV